MAEWKKILTEGNVTPTNLATDPDEGEVLKVNGSGALEWGTTSGTGTVTNVTANAATVSGIGLSITDGTTTPEITLTGPTNIVSLTEANLKTVLADLTAASGIVYILDDTNATDVRIRGNLLIDGSTTTLSTTELVIDDNEIILNNNATGSASEHAGFTVERGTDPNKTFYWDESQDQWAIGNTLGTPEAFISGFLSVADSSGTPGSGILHQGKGQLLWDETGTTLYIRIS